MNLSADALKEHQSSPDTLPKYDSKYSRYFQASSIHLMGILYVCHEYSNKTFHPCTDFSPSPGAKTNISSF